MPRRHSLALRNKCEAENVVSEFLLTHWNHQVTDSLCTLLLSNPAFNKRKIQLSMYNSWTNDLWYNLRMNPWNELPSAFSTFAFCYRCYIQQLMDTVVQINFEIIFCIQIILWLSNVLSFTALCEISDDPVLLQVTPGSKLCHVHFNCVKFAKYGRFY